MVEWAFTRSELAVFLSLCEGRSGEVVICHGYVDRVLNAERPMSNRTQSVQRNEGLFKLFDDQFAVRNTVRVHNVDRVNASA